MPRYIDADALMKRIYGDERPEIYDGAEEVDWILKCVDDAPTLSPDEVRGVGEWVDYQQGRWVYAQCSECGTVHDVRSNYCPNCGARMEVSEDA